MTEKIIFKFGKSGKLAATEEGLNLTGATAFTEELLDGQLSQLGTDKFSKALQLAMPVLIEQGHAAIVDGRIIIPSVSVTELYHNDLGLKSWLPSWCPFTMAVESKGSLGDPHLKYSYSFFQGPNPVYPSLTGSLLVFGSKIYTLPKSLFQLIQKIERFNSSDGTTRSKGDALIVLSEIKSLAQLSGTGLDSYLSQENVVVPDKVGVGLDFDSEGRLSMFPRFESVSEEDLKRVFLRLTDAQDVYDLETPDGGRLRVVLPLEIKQAIQRMRKVSHIGGKQRDQIIANPRSVFDGIENQDCLDLGQFGPRVKGVGTYIFQPKPYVKPVSGKFLDLETEDLFSTNHTGAKKYQSGIQAEDADGNPVDIPFQSSEELSSLKDKVDTALASGEAVIQVRDESGQERTLPVSDDLQAGLAALEEKAKAPEERLTRSDKDTAALNRQDLRYLLIYENEDVLDYSETSDGENIGKELVFKKPNNLIGQLNGKPFELKPYQQKGVAWLQNCFSNPASIGGLAGRRGVLLADDMGLGKTLQILSFLAWCIEDALSKDLGKDVGPYKPLLVVAPVILLENWKQELEKFFKDDGKIFLPYDVVYGDRLKVYQREKPVGKEYQVGQSVLNLDKLKSNRLIITNYDTVKNYQHSFAKLEWSVVIIDEAQEIKEPKTAVTWAMKSLNALFKIALTGTPVENRLLDLWNITDFYQPGLLGSAKEFTHSFEAGLDSLTEIEKKGRADELRKRLRYNGSDAYVFRRTKSDELQGLPKKIEHVIETPLSPEQISMHHEIIGSLRAASGESPGRHLKAVQQLSRLYQHIALDLEARIEQSGKHYCATSPKLQRVMELLEQIRSNREKVLIFAVSTKMQFILQRAIEERFRLKPDIVNGSVSTAISGGTSLRRKIINRFEAKSGFNALILSPDVAGVGLTITAANNVIHYGRWWNPAKEAQATDRVYRLGQTKEVNVYYPISTAPAFTSFDLRLHELLRRKRELAEDFLMPVNHLEITHQELLQELSGPGTDSVIAKTSSVPITQLDDLDPDRFSALCAELFTSSGYEVVLTPSTQNGGIDVVGTKGREVVLAACLFNLSGEDGQGIQADSLKRASEYYKKQVLPASMENWKFRLAFLTNVRVSGEIATSAKRNAVEVIDRKELESFLRKSKISMTKLNAIVESRLSTIDGIKDKLMSASPVP